MKSWAKKWFVFAAHICLLATLTLGCDDAQPKENPATATTDQAGGTTASGYPVLAGNWVNKKGLPCSIQQTDSVLSLTNGDGLQSQGGFKGPSDVFATDWGRTATVSSDGRTLSWADGAVWTKQ